LTKGELRLNPKDWGVIPITKTLSKYVSLVEIYEAFFTILARGLATWAHFCMQMFHKTKCPTMIMTRI
jgi:hypothetical protein